MWEEGSLFLLWIESDNCNTWKHKKCTDLTTAQYHKLQKKETHEQQPETPEKTYDQQPETHHQQTESQEEPHCQRPETPEKTHEQQFEFLEKDTEICYNKLQKVYVRITTIRKNKDGIQNQLFATPTQQAYAKYMRGVDRLDQMTRVAKEKKSMRWYRKIEFKLQAISICNSYVTNGYISDHEIPNKRKRDLLSFKLELANGLIGDFSCLQKT
ncbi:unnamed protein product [Mytilus coruscus]|uniref:PiggyBac transposable element-derived protein domain-containing protein n=1 Tax=Mytilus coruscus TaxID=42192 RepID=A0A6J8D943_MYTCO|nr:unnamed protein product [Mytilus coruscus]